MVQVLGHQGFALSGQPVADLEGVGAEVAHAVDEAVVTSQLPRWWVQKPSNVGLSELTCSQNRSSPYPPSLHGIGHLLLYCHQPPAVCWPDWNASASASSICGRRISPLKTRVTTPLASMKMLAGPTDP